MTKLTDLNKAYANRTAEVYGVQDEQDASLNARDISEVSAIPAAMSRSKKLTVGFIGDSIAGGFGTYSFITSPMAHAMMRYYPADVIWNGSSFANGGMNYSIGGWTSTQVLDVQVDQVRERTPDILLVHCGTNDGHNNLAEITYPNTLQILDECLEAGVQHIFYLPILPRINNPDGAANVINHNNRMQSYINSHSRITFIDCCDLWVDNDLNVNPYNPIGGESDDLGSFTTGGLHVSATGADAIAKRFVRYLEKLVPERPKRHIFRGSGAALGDSSNDIFAGRGSMTVGGGQLNTVTNANVPEGFTLEIDPALTQTTEFVYSPELNRYVMRISLAGTASQGEAIRFTTFHNSGSVYSRGSGFEAVTDLNIIDNSGLLVPTFQFRIGGSDGDTVSVSGGGALCNHAPLGMYHLYIPRPVMIGPEDDSRSQGQYFLVMRTVVGTVIDSVVEISNVGLFKVVGNN